MYNKCHQLILQKNYTFGFRLKITRWRWYWHQQSFGKLLKSAPYISLLSKMEQKWFNLCNRFWTSQYQLIILIYIWISLVQSMAARWPRLTKKQASWALLFYLSVSVPPSGNSGWFWVGYSTREYLLKRFCAIWRWKVK